MNRPAHDRRRARRALTRRSPRADAAAVDEREMVASLERDKRRPIGLGRRGRSRLRAERRLQPFAKAARGVGTDAKAALEIAAEVDRLPGRCRAARCSRHRHTLRHPRAHRDDRGRRARARTVRPGRGHEPARPDSDEATTRASDAVSRCSVTFRPALAGELQRLVDRLESVLPPRRLGVRPVDRHANTVESQRVYRLEISRGPLAVAREPAGIRHADPHERLRPPRRAAPPGVPPAAGTPLSRMADFMLLGHCRRGFRLTARRNGRDRSHDTAFVRRESRDAMTVVPATTTFVTLEDIRAAAARIAPIARVTPLVDVSAAGRTTVLPQVREPAAGRRVQDPRRLQHGGAAHRRRARRRRHHLLVRQSRPGDGARRPRARRAGGRRHADDRAARSRSTARGRSAPK